MGLLTRKPKPYHGRLAFDSASGFHIDPKGKRVVSDDGGLTWRYATSKDTSHVERYHKNYVTVDSTANELIALAVKHGSEKAEEILRENSPHHFNVTVDDPHHPSRGGVIAHPDPVAATITSHTDSPHSGPEGSGKEEDSEW